MPSFGPVEETHDEELKRILGYKHVSINDNGSDLYYQPVSISQKDNGNFCIQHLTNDMKPIEGRYCEIEDPKVDWPQVEFLPDYDRNVANYPVARKIMKEISRGKKLTHRQARRVKKCIEDVPPESMDVYKAFMDCGEGIQIKCMKIDTAREKFVLPLHSYLSNTTHCCEVGLTDHNIEERSRHRAFFIFLE